MNLATETTNNFNELEIIAHCLYEMTFCGFNEEEIKEQFDTINDSIEEYKNMTEEEKNENTITLDELIRRIDEGDNSEQPFAESGSDV
jgi:cell division septum initiation protein DivIVA